PQSWTRGAGARSSAARCTRYCGCTGDVRGSARAPRPPLRRFVLEELEGYLDCGRLTAGCARFECEGCGLTRVTGLSCKGRGCCPRCCVRRMTERARHLADGTTHVSM